LKKFFLFLLICAVVESKAQNHYKKIDRSAPSLVARRSGSGIHFRLGAAVRIVTVDQKIIRGYITHFGKDEFTVEPFVKGEAKIISPASIERIRFVSRRGRRTAVIILAAGAIYTTALTPLSKPGSLQYVPFLPAMAAALFFVYYYPSTFLVDWLSEKKSSRGWTFSIEG
jgi:hypothetical protein